MKMDALSSLKLASVFWVRGCLVLWVLEVRGLTRVKEE